MACGCKKDKARTRQTMMRVTTEYFELVVPGEGTHRFDDIEAARARRTELGVGQIRERQDYQDVPAAYEVRLGDEVVLTTMKAPEAAQATLNHPGAKVWMVPSKSLVAT